MKRLIILFLLLLCACAKEIKLEQFESNQWMAEIKGEVNCPGVYPIQADTNLSDLIAMAEGVNDDADLTSLNLSQLIQDQMVVVIPKEQQIKKISLNAASKEELMTLKGIGEKKASDIVAYRNEHGGFKKLEELMEVKGIGEKTYERLKDMICL